VSLQGELRERLALAVTVDVEIDGTAQRITGHTIQPDVISPYDAWLVWRSTDVVNRCVREVRWLLLVALPPASPAAYTALGDQIAEVLAEPLMPLARIEQIEPVELVLDINAPLPCVQFEIIT
jgi:hypothetical protein